VELLNSKGAVAEDLRPVALAPGAQVVSNFVFYTCSPDAAVMRASVTKQRRRTAHVTATASSYLAIGASNSCERAQGKLNYVPWPLEHLRSKVNTIESTKLKVPGHTREDMSRWTWSRSRPSDEPAYQHENAHAVSIEGAGAAFGSGPVRARANAGGTRKHL
jgi:hypothetical protein